MRCRPYCKAWFELETNRIKRLFVADTFVSRFRGALGKNQLVVGDALWIKPCNSVHTFGMTYSIDVIYLDAQKRIKKIVTDIRPNRVSGSLKAKSVVEMKSGEINRLDLRVGMFMNVENIK